MRPTEWGEEEICRGTEMSTGVRRVRGSDLLVGRTALDGRGLAMVGACVLRWISSFCLVLLFQSLVKIGALWVFVHHHDNMSTPAAMKVSRGAPQVEVFRCCFPDLSGALHFKDRGLWLPCQRAWLLPAFRKPVLVRNDRGGAKASASLRCLCVIVAGRAYRQ